jgi:hypothetical protein
MEYKRDKFGTPLQRVIVALPVPGAKRTRVAELIQFYYLLQCTFLVTFCRMSNSPHPPITCSHTSLL